jgi:hypothetical protein
MCALFRSEEAEILTTEARGDDGLCAPDLQGAAGPRVGGQPRGQRRAQGDSRRVMIKPDFLLKVWESFKY